MSLPQDLDDEPPGTAAVPPQADDGSVYGRPTNPEEEEIFSRTPASDLGLSVRASKTAETLGFTTAAEIARADRDSVGKVKNCGRTTVAELRHALIQALQDATAPLPEVDAARADDLKAQVDGLLSRLDDRSQLVLRSRFGLWDGEKKTLEEVAGILHLTRERVRQIEAKGIRALRGGLLNRIALFILDQLRGFYLDPIRCPSFAGVLTPGDVDVLLEEPGKAPSADDTTRALALRFLVAVFDEDLERFKDGVAANDDDLWFATEAAAKRFRGIEAEVRTLLASRGRPMGADELSKHLDSSGLRSSAAELKRLGQISPEISFSLGALALRRWNKFQRGRAAARIERAFAELGQPTHWSFIVEKLNFLFPEKAPFVGHAITATMLRYPDVFVSLGRGTYALRNWGVMRPPYVKDFVIETMRRAGGQATIDYVAALGAKKYGFKHSSIAMTMSLNPTFFEHLKGDLYRLR